MGAVDDVVLPAGNGPTADDLGIYLDLTGSTWLTESPESVAAALAAEATDQANRCRFPLDELGVPTYDAALGEALCRRVAHNLAVRALPLGVEATITDGAALNTYVGGMDAEVRRLEGPYRKRKVG